MTDSGAVNAAPTTAVWPPPAAAVAAAAGPALIVSANVAGVVPAGPVAVALPADGSRDYAHRLAVGGRLTNPFLLDLDDGDVHRAHLRPLAPDGSGPSWDTDAVRAKYSGSGRPG